MLVIMCIIGESMRDKAVDKIMIKIKQNNKDLDDIKLSEIKYGLQGLYTMITKTSVIFILALLLGIFKEFIIFFLFYSLLRSVGFGVHAKSNIHCWIFSIFLLLGMPALFSYIHLNMTIKVILWIVFFINFILFSPADTKKRPIINKKRKFKFKLVELFLCFIYLLIIIYFENISNLVLGAMMLEALLVNPLGYILMGEKVRFRLNDLYMFKLN